MAEECLSIGRSSNIKKFQCPPNHYNDLASLFFNTNDGTIRNLYSAGSDDEFNRYSVLLFFVTSYFLGIFSHALVVPSGLFVPVILTGAAYGRFCCNAVGTPSILNPVLYAVLGSASFLGASMRMTVCVCYTTRTNKQSSSILKHFTIYCDRDDVACETTLAVYRNWVGSISWLFRMHPSWRKNRWKRLRFGRMTLIKYFGS